MATTITLTRDGRGKYTATNSRGRTIKVGSGDDSDDFGPIELLLAALAGCSALDVDFITSRRSEASEFTVTARGTKVRGEDGNRMTNVSVTFNVQFPEGPDGDAAREVLPQSVQMSHDRLCTVGRTIQLPTPVEMHAE
ncbi:MAG TPA: OsmC family protein [Actinomycetaceae bacterium]|nr:OsmC family protein [Actinomycetaceae bacterium]